MKTLLQRTILPVWVVMSFSAMAQFITPEEAVFLANKHIRYEIDRFGQWNGDTTIHIDKVHDLFCKGQKVGYYSNIQPTGIIILNLRKEFHADIHLHTAEIDPSHAERAALVNRYNLTRYSQAHLL